MRAVVIAVMVQVDDCLKLTPVVIQLRMQQRQMAASRTGTPGKKRRERERDAKLRSQSWKADDEAVVMVVMVRVDY